MYYYQYGGSDTIYNYKTGDEIHFDDSKTGFESLALDGGGATLGTTYTGTFNASWYAENPDTINASANRNSIVVYGNDNANVMYGGEGTTTICAGAGEDTIYCGAGVDKIYFYKDDGNETVYDIGDGDQVALNNCSATSVSVSGTDVIITTNYAETITLKDGTGKNIWISGQNWKTYDAEEVSESAALFADDNFDSGADLDALIDTGGALTNLTYRATDPNEIFAQNITYSDDK